MTATDSVAAPIGGHLEALRRVELERVRRWFSPGDRVLEIGGADGYQARLLADWGCRVTSIDLADRPRGGPAFFDVQPYDGQRLPFESESFDRVFSSNVLEHVRDVPTMLAETHRVLRRGGRCVHILPTAAWRFWTSLSHYPHLAVAAYRRIFPSGHASSSAGLEPAAPARSENALRAIGRRLFAGAHGEYSSAWAELYYYRPARWRRLFQAQGFRVVASEPARLFYTGYEIIPSLPMRWRETLSRVLGSACFIYVLEPAGGVE